MQDVNTVEQERDSIHKIAKMWSAKLGETLNNVSEEILVMTERELEQNFTPTTKDYFLRKQFWKKTRELQAQDGMIASVSEIYKNICTMQHFYNRVLKNPYRLVWILTPMKSADDMVEEAFHYAFNKVRDEVLNMEVNEKTAPIILKALDLLMQRHLGPMVQRIEAKSMNVNMTADEMREISDVADRFKQIQQKAGTKLINGGSGEV